MSACPKRGFLSQLDTFVRAHNLSDFVIQLNRGRAKLIPV